MHRLGGVIFTSTHREQRRWRKLNVQLVLLFWVNNVMRQLFFFCFVFLLTCLLELGFGKALFKEQFLCVGLGLFVQWRDTTGKWRPTLTSYFSDLSSWLNKPTPWATHLTCRLHVHKIWNRHVLGPLECLRPQYPPFPLRFDDGISIRTKWCLKVNQNVHELRSAAQYLKKMLQKTRKPNMDRIGVVFLPKMWLRVKPKNKLTDRKTAGKFWQLFKFGAQHLNCNIWTTFLQRAHGLQAKNQGAIDRLSSEATSRLDRSVARWSHSDASSLATMLERRSGRVETPS